MADRRRAEDRAPAADGGVLLPRAARDPSRRAVTPLRRCPPPPRPQTCPPHWSQGRASAPAGRSPTGSPPTRACGAPPACSRTAASTCWPTTPRPLLPTFRPRRTRPDGGDAAAQLPGADRTLADLPGPCRHGDALLDVSSTLGWTPKPDLAVYSATKAYTTALTEALWAAHRSDGVRVLASCPGTTRTEAQPREDVPAAPVQAPEQVAAALRALRRGTAPTAVSGTAARRRLLLLAARLLPRRRTPALFAR
ncbi:SDR family NAD(P)-dependent oxidoreductase [Kitasatospora sp. NPDC001540]|uniref:SDR family NAD(P)-dependent oxidoreductase n=1 Tax=Kitasatospora sp. NPDC001540 TaxID=3364014 RepID=UPI0036B7C294